MADYYPLIARAVAGLEKNTGDARRALYERARTALVAQLRSVNPPLSENDVTRERLALEESIRKVEAEAARKNWVDPAQAAPPRVRAPEFPRWDPPPPSAPAPAEAEADTRPATRPLRSSPVPAQEEAEPRPVARALRSSPVPAEEEAEPRLPARPPRASPGPSPTPAAPDSNMMGGERYVDPVFDRPLPSSEQAPIPQARATTARQRSTNDRRSLLDGGLKDFRGGVSETDEAGEMPPRTAKPPREPLPAPLPASHDFDRMEGHAHDSTASTLPEYPAPPMLEQSHDYDDPRPAAGRARHGMAVERSTSGRSFRGVMKIAVNVVILATLGALLAWQWPNISSLYRSMRTPGTEVARETPPPAASKPRKFTERLEQNGGPPTAAAPVQPAPASIDPANPAAAVAQKVVLYEEDPSDPNGRRYVGSAIWRTEQVSPGPNQPAEIAIRADVEIPDRKLAMTWSLRRNTDQSLPASHTVEIMFRLPQDFASGGISNVPGILMKASEQTRGVPLAGLAVKVTNGFFLIGLSSAEADRERNLAMLKERQWFDIPVVYNNNRRAILAVEKGTPGERVFAEAFAAWRQ